MQEGFQAVASIGALELLGDRRCGGENRCGGVCAKGVPRNLSTLDVAEGSTVVVPRTRRPSIVAEGPS